VCITTAAVPSVFISPSAIRCAVGEVKWVRADHSHSASCIDEVVSFMFDCLLRGSEKKIVLFYAWCDIWQRGIRSSSANGVHRSTLCGWTNAAYFCRAFQPLTSCWSCCIWYSKGQPMQDNLPTWSKFHCCPGHHLQGFTARTLQKLYVFSYQGLQGQEHSSSPLILRHRQLCTVLP